MIYPEAKLLADSLVEAMAPFCERIEIAGSVRRKKPVVKDIEICVIPRRESRADVSNLFAPEKDVNTLHEDWALTGACFNHICVPAIADWSDPALVKSWPVVNAQVHWIKPGTKEGTPLAYWRVEADGAYWRGLVWLGEQPDEPVSLNQEALPRHVKLDLFLTTEEKWGVIFLLRTGSREFNLALIERTRERNTPIENGRILNFGKAVHTPEEKDVFDFLGLDFIEPQFRTGKDALRTKRL
jgi:hypothetical protein